MRFAFDVLITYACTFLHMIYGLWGMNRAKCAGIWPHGDDLVLCALSYLNKFDKAQTIANSALYRTHGLTVGIYGKSIKNVLGYNLSLRRSKSADIIID